MKSFIRSLDIVIITIVVVCAALASAHALVVQARSFKVEPRVNPTTVTVPIDPISMAD